MQHEVVRATSSVQLGPAEIQPLVDDAVVFANQHGLVVALKDPKFVNPDYAVIHAPLSLTPVPYPRARFELAQQVMPLFNTLVDAVAADESYLETTLRPAAAQDAFTGRLLSCLQATRPERQAMQAAGREVVLGIHRSDYMLDAPSGRYLQVELNTIASSFGCLSALMTRLHGYMASGRISGLDASRLPPNPTLEHIPDAIAAAAAASGHVAAGGVVVMVVQPGERNAYDQQWIQLQLWERHRLRTLRLTLADIAAGGRLDPATRTLTLPGGQPAAVFYFRAGYTPADYPSEAEWAARELIERSNAAKCPTVAYQLAGTKKVQQDLATPGVLERFLPPATAAADAALLREFFAGLWSLDPRDLAADAGGAAAAVRDAVARPEAYVLKPQREGGGNNLYGEELRAALQKGGEELSAYILMQRILPPVNRSVLVRNGQWQEAETLSELGIYGTFVRHNAAVLVNRQSGHLVRTKTANSNEGGVAAGFAVLDSPYLVD
ncbi:hypothetical protein HXX76_005696 [Chlamydomonas incerta]|uniref:Glutathione synthetase n=1 Tax=Chlamydomonas incerta TaxID=51695 RepID=A0A835W2F8_CHLIN|nr:hypothetical protein HXX76_005696 [Chlamydomonas incerta]|eukprot:KAG2438087.1 hypothetical protein HXX76_005696 [Chlamydomonas incerta]